MAVGTSHLDRFASEVAKTWIYTDFDFGGEATAYLNAVAVGQYAFPVYDKIFAASARVSPQEVQRIFSVLRRVNADYSKYVPVARKFAFDDSAETKAATLRFLARYGGKPDVKFALAFLCAPDGDLVAACLDVLARHGGREESQLISAVLGHANGAWSQETRDYARERLTEMEKRLAAEQVKPAPKP